jgi:exosortase A-associated hydrolase 2
MRGLCEHFLLPRGTDDERFCIHRAPAQAEPRGVLLQLQAFGEEMNASRRALAQASRALAGAGWAVLQIDLRGCGESSGSLDQLSLSDWLQDIADATAWLRQRWPGAPLWLWGHRAGALLALAALQSGVQADLLLWQPLLNGQELWRQQARLKAAALMAAGDSQAADADVAAVWMRGAVAEVAGYRLGSALMTGLRALTLEPPAGRAGRLVWLDAASNHALPPPPARLQAAARWSTAGWTVERQALAAPAFWATVANLEAPAWVSATVQALGEPSTVIA